MSRGKYLSLEEARESGKLDRFANEHPSKADRNDSNRLLNAMSQGVLEEAETSTPDRPQVPTEFEFDEVLSKMPTRYMHMGSRIERFSIDQNPSMP